LRFEAVARDGLRKMNRKARRIERCIMDMGAVAEGRSVQSAVS